MAIKSIPMVAGAIHQQDDTLREFERTGVIVFERTVNLSLVKKMHEVWEEYFSVFAGRRPEMKRFLMHLPFKAPLYDPAFVEHPAVLKLVDKLLGADCICSYFGSETPLPGADYQLPHFDLAFLSRFRWMNKPLALANKLLGSLHYYYGIQVSLALVDSRRDNAPLEIWPGSNRITLRTQPSTLLQVPAGSLIVRDIRCLHRGTPHAGLDARPFLSLVYLRPWVPGWRAPEIPSETYAQLPQRSKRLFRSAAIGQTVPDAEGWAQRRR